MAIILILLLLGPLGLVFEVGLVSDNLLSSPQFYWKEDNIDYAQSGMPDFDQRQWGTYNWTDQWDTWSHCGPVAVANSLWWYDSAYENSIVPPPTINDSFSLVTAYGSWDDHDPQNVQPFVEHIAYLINTDGNRTGLTGEGHTGTNVTDMEAGIAQYLSWTGVNPLGDVNGDGKVDYTDLNIVINASQTTPGMMGWDIRADIWPVTTTWPTPGVADNIVDTSDLNLVIQNWGRRDGMFYEHTVPKPDFFFVADEVEWCQDVVLSLGFYYGVEVGNTTEYWRDDYPYPLGHSVTVAGIDSNAMQIAISDPGLDAFEMGLSLGRSPIPHLHMPPEPPFTTHNNASLVSHDIYSVTFNTVMGMWELVGYAGSTPPKHVMIEYAVITSPIMQCPDGRVPRLRLVVDGDAHEYHGIAWAIEEELAKIGVGVAIEYRNATAIADTVWGAYWNKTWYEAPGRGWDLSISEWEMMPTGLIPLEPLVSSWATPPEGCNIMSWMNERADLLLQGGMTELRANHRMHALWLWQEEFMHDPPMISLYYPRVYEVTGVYVEGWDPVVRFHDVSNLFVNATAFDLYAPDHRKAIGNDTLIYGVDEPVDNFNPLFTSTSTEEKLNLLTHDTLYALSIDPWPATEMETDPQNYKMRPDLATASPVWLSGMNGPNTRVRIPLRANVSWSDGVPFNATDVKFTFDLILNPDTDAVAYRDFAHVVESVEIVNETCVDFILYEPYADITTLLGIPGATIIPWHTLKDIPRNKLRAHPSNSDWTQYLPGTGPFNLTNARAIADTWQMELTRNSLYFGYDLGWGPYGIDTLFLWWIPDAADRLMTLQTLEIDFVQRLIEPAHIFQMMQTWPTHRVWQYDQPSSNLLFFNLNHPFLSNRYVRQAIAHAINYPHIIDDILPASGVEGYLGKTPVLPHHYYTDESILTVPLFNVYLPPYEYNIVVAQQYMDMWSYSLSANAPVGSPWVEMGPVGDFDFSGFVDMSDFVIWAANIGTVPDIWPWSPGRDIDPDADNNDYVELADFYDWRENIGEYYPFRGAR